VAPGLRQYLRELGIEANATERAVRGKRESSKLDGIYRAERRGMSAVRASRLTASRRSY